VIVLRELPLGSAIAPMAKGSITQLVGSFAVSAGQHTLLCLRHILAEQFRSRSVRRFPSECRRLRARPTPETDCVDDRRGASG
jgi:hypothetical protein